MGDIIDIWAYLDNQDHRSATDLGLFAFTSADLFEMMQLETPLNQPWLFISTVRASIRWRCC